MTTPASAPIKPCVPTPPRALNHIGITVPDIYAAIDWYQAVFGFSHIMGPRVLQATSSVTHETPTLFGPKFRKAYQAHLITANGIGLELFQFVDPPVKKPADNLEYWKIGYWHLCFTDPDIEGLAARIVAAGGRQRIPVYEFIPGRPYKLVYCEDPFGNIIELFSHHYAEAFSNWPQPGMAPQAILSREEFAAEMAALQPQGAGKGAGKSAARAAVKPAREAMPAKVTKPAPRSAAQRGKTKARAGK